MTSTSPNAATAGDDGKALPQPRGEERAWFDGALAGIVALTHCRSCSGWSLPRVVCPHCWSEDVGIEPAQGTGTIYSFTVLQRAGRPGFEADVPYVVALVDLDEGPRVMTNIVRVAPESVRIGDRVRAEFRRRGELAFPDLRAGGNVSALDRIAIVGAAEAGVGHAPHLSPLGMMALATVRAAEDAGLSVGDIDGVFAITPYHHLTSLSFCEYLQIFPRYHDSTQIGGCTFVAFLRHAAAAIAAGMCEVAVIAYGSSQRSDAGKLVSASEISPFEVPHGAAYPISSFALIAQRHMHEYGTTPEQLAEVAVAHRAWAQLTPGAYYRDPISVADVLASPMISTPLHRLDCCAVTDGGGAVIVTTKERARTLRRPPVHVLGGAEGYTHRNIAAMADLTASAATQTGAAAFAEAGLHPSDMDFAQVYDAFTISALMILEDLGFCAKGEGGPLYASGRTRPGGDLPVNTNGGGLSYCHPGMLSLFLLIEGIRQLRGECGARQVQGAEVGVVHGLGGTFAAAATAILARGDAAG